MSSSHARKSKASSNGNSNSRSSRRKVSNSNSQSLHDRGSSGRGDSALLGFIDEDENDVGYSVGHGYSSSEHQQALQQQAPQQQSQTQTKESRRSSSKQSKKPKRSKSLPKPSLSLPSRDDNYNNSSSKHDENENDRCHKYKSRKKTKSTSDMAYTSSTHSQTTTTLDSTKKKLRKRGRKPAVDGTTELPSELLKAMAAAGNSNSNTNVGNSNSNKDRDDTRRSKKKSSSKRLSKRSLSVPSMPKSERRSRTLEPSENTVNVPKSMGDLSFDEIRNNTNRSSKSRDNTNNHNHSNNHNHNHNSTAKSSKKKTTSEDERNDDDELYMVPLAPPSRARLITTTRDTSQKSEGSNTSKQQQHSSSSFSMRTPRTTNSSHIGLLENPNDTDEAESINDSNSNTANNENNEDRSKSRSSSRSFRKARSLFGALKSVGSYDSNDDKAKQKQKQRYSNATTNNNNTNTNSSRKRSILMWAKKKMGNAHNNINSKKKEHRDNNNPDQNGVLQEDQEALLLQLDSDDHYNDHYNRSSNNNNNNNNNMNLVDLLVVVDENENETTQATTPAWIEEEKSDNDNDNDNERDEGRIQRISVQPSPDQPIQDEQTKTSRTNANTNDRDHHRDNNNNQHDSNSNSSNSGPLNESPNNKNSHLGNINQNRNTNTNTQSSDERLERRMSMDSVGTMDNSQDLPPIAQINTNTLLSCDPDLEQDLSDIGETTADDRFCVLEPEIIDGVTVIYLPPSTDIVYGDRGHQGTKDMIYVLRDILQENLDDIDFSPKVYKAIKKKLKGRKFLVRTNFRHNHNNERTSWKEATKAENIQLLGEAFEEEKRRRTQGVDDTDYGTDSDDSEIEDSLEGSAGVPSAESILSVGDQSPSINTDQHQQNNQNNTAKNNHANINLALRPEQKQKKLRSVIKRLEQIQSDDDINNNNKNDDDDQTPFDSKATPRQGNLHSGDNHKDRRNREIPSIQRALQECVSAQELARPIGGDNENVHKGIASEQKLLSLIAMMDGDTPETKTMQRELAKLEELATRMKYASIALLFERLEAMEINIADYFRQQETKEHQHTSHDDDNYEDNYGDDEVPYNYDDDDDREEVLALPEDNEKNGRAGPTMEMDGDVYTMKMESSASFEDMDIDEVENNHLDEPETRKELLHDIDHGDDHDYDDDDDDSGTNKEGQILKFDDDASDDLSSVGDSGIYDSTSDEDASDDEDDNDDDDMDMIDIVDDDDYDDDEGTRTIGSSDDDDLTVESVHKKTIFEKPNPKLKQFFDRLAHFFETRRRIEERAKSIDPSKKCVKIKVKPHSGGILKKNDKYKKEYQQHDVQDRLVRNLDDLYDAAQHAQTEFEAYLTHLVSAVKGLDKHSLILPQLKPRDRAFEKAKAEYHRRSPGPPESWLYDIVRGGIICKTTKQLSEVNKWLTKNAHLVQAKNRFAEPVFNGYRDLLYHISIPYKDGSAHVCEIQVHHKDMYLMNEQFGTIKHYDFFRSCFANPWRSQEDILSDLAMMNKYSKIEGPLMKTLLKSQDSEQLRLFAGLFRDKLDEFDRSLELYRRVLNLQEDAHGSDHEEMAGTYLSIGLVLGALGDTDQSLLNLLKALAIQESFLGMDHVEVANSYVEIGRMLAKRGDYSGAFTQYQRTLEIRESKFGKDHFLVIKSLQEIGLVLQQKCDFKESEKEYRKALKIQQDVLGDGHPDVATTHSLIGDTLCLYGDYVKAMAEYRLALSAREKGLGKNHPTAAESHTAIGVLLFRRGDYKTSRWHHTRALRIRESMLGKDDETCAISHRYLGEVHSLYGDYEGAILELKRAQEIMEANVGMDHTYTAGAYLDLGHIHCRHHHYEDALAEYRRAMVIRESILGNDHPDTGVTYMCVGNALRQKGDYDEALALHRKALIIFESVLGDTHTLTATGYEAMADSLSCDGSVEQALNEHRRALRIRRTILLQDHPDISSSCSKIGNVLLLSDTEMYDPIGAMGIFRLALSITVGRCGNVHPETAMARFDVARALIAMADRVATNDKDAWGFLDEAEEKIRDSLLVLNRVDPNLGGSNNSKEISVDSSGGSIFGCLPTSEGITGRAYIALGNILVMKGGCDEEAHDSYTEGMERLVGTLGSDHPEILETERKLLSLVER